MPRRPARRRTSTPHPCNGACGLAACTYVSTRRGALTDHVNAGRGVRPYACALCAYATSFKQDLTSHARRAHPEHCAPDGSCKALGVGPRRPRRLRMPGAFRDAGVAPQEFQVVKQMVRDCNRNDLRAFPDDPYVAEVHGATRSATASRASSSARCSAGGSCGTAPTTPAAAGPSSCGGTAC